MPMQVKKGADARRIAETVNQYLTDKSAQYRGQLVGEPSAERALVVYSAEYRQMVEKAEAQRAKNIRLTDQYCRKIEAEIIRQRMATDAYVNNMWYAFFTGKQAHVDPKTGEVKNADPDEVTTNSEGQAVLKEDADREGGADNAHPLQEPQVENFMEGVEKNVDFSKQFLLRKVAPQARCLCHPLRKGGGTGF